MILVLQHDAAERPCVKFSARCTSNKAQRRQNKLANWQTNPYRLDNINTNNSQSQWIDKIYLCTKQHKPFGFSTESANCFSCAQRKTNRKQTQTCGCDCTSNAKHILCQTTQNAVFCSKTTFFKLAYYSSESSAIFPTLIRLVPTFLPKGTPAVITTLSPFCAIPKRRTTSSALMNISSVLSNV